MTAPSERPEPPSLPSLRPLPPPVHAQPLRREPPPPLFAQRIASTPVPETVVPPAPAPPAPAATAFRVRLPDGIAHEVTVPTVVGRHPSTADAPGAVPLAVADASGRVSRSHVLLEPGDRALWVRDLASTNGSVVVRPDGTEVDVASAGRTRLDVGDELEVGGVVLLVEASVPA